MAALLYLAPLMNNVSPGDEECGQQQLFSAEGRQMSGLFLSLYSLHYVDSPWRLYAELSMMYDIEYVF